MSYSIVVVVVVVVVVVAVVVVVVVVRVVVRVISCPCNVLAMFVELSQSTIIPCTVREREKKKSRISTVSLSVVVVSRERENHIHILSSQCPRNGSKHPVLLLLTWTRHFMFPFRAAALVEDKVL